MKHVLQRHFCPALVKVPSIAKNANNLASGRKSYQQLVSKCFVLFSTDRLVPVGVTTKKKTVTDQTDAPSSSPAKHSQQQQQQQRQHKREQEHHQHSSQNSSNAHVDQQQTSRHLANFSKFRTFRALRRNYSVSTPQKTNTLYKYKYSKKHTSQEIPTAHADDPAFHCYTQALVAANPSEHNVFTIVYAFLHTSFHFDSEVCPSKNKYKVNPKQKSVTLIISSPKVSREAS